MYQRSLCIAADEGTSPTKQEGNDSDSDSDASMDRNSLDLASSHSSDEDDDFEMSPPWDQHISKSKAVGERETLDVFLRRVKREGSYRGEAKCTATTRYNSDSLLVTHVDDQRSLGKMKLNEPGRRN